MALGNFVITLAGVGAVVFLMKSDIRTGSAMLRRNLRHIRGWMEEQTAAAERSIKEETKHLPKPEVTEAAKDAAKEAVKKD